MPFSSYTFLHQLGKGSFGTIHLAKHKEEQQYYVIKVIPIDQLKGVAVNKEVDLMKSIQHPYIVAYKESFEHTIVNNFPTPNTPASVTSLYIVMSYADNGDLDKYMKLQREPIPETQVLDWFVQLCLALQYLHANNIIHRDVKAENIFLMKPKATVHGTCSTVLLGDFGISKRLPDSNANAVTRIGTPYYLSPEICMDRPYNSRSDVWSLGCLLYEMCMFKHPFDANSMDKLLQAICKTPHQPIDRARGYSSEVRFLCDLLLSKKSAARPSMEEVLAMPFLKSYVQKWKTIHNDMTRIAFNNAPNIKTTNNLSLLPPIVIQQQQNNNNNNANSNHSQNNNVPINNGAIPCVETNEERAERKQREMRVEENSVSPAPPVPNPDRVTKVAERRKQKVSNEFTPPQTSNNNIQSQSAVPSQPSQISSQINTSNNAPPSKPTTVFSIQKSINPSPTFHQGNTNNNQPSNSNLPSISRSRSRASLPIGAKLPPTNQQAAPANSIITPNNNPNVISPTGSVISNSGADSDLSCNSLSPVSQYNGAVQPIISPETIPNKDKQPPSQSEKNSPVQQHHRILNTQKEDSYVKSVQQPPTRKASPTGELSRYKPSNEQSEALEQFMRAIAAKKQASCLAQPVQQKRVMA